MASSPIPMFTGSSAPGVANPLTTNPTGMQGGGTTGGGMPVIGASPNARGTVPMTPGGVTASPIAGGPSSNPLSTLIGAIPGGGTGANTTATGENNQVMPGNTQTQRQDNRTLGELQSYYGEGMGSYLYSLMQNGGLNTNLLNQVDTSQIAAMQPQINQGEANLNATLGAQGISPNSSTAALANSNFLSNATTQENAQISNNFLREYDQGQQLLESILGGVMKTNQQGTANEPSIMDQIMSFGGLLGSGAQGASSIVSALNPTADTSILDAIGGLAAL